MRRKGQITMESLLLYGVAILVVLLAVGALTFFGVLDLGRLLPDRCNLASQALSCEEWQVSQAGTVQLGIQNVGAQPVNVDRLVFEADIDRTCTFEPGSPQQLQPGEREGFTLDCDGPLPDGTVGNKVRGSLSATYRNVPGAIELTSSGTLVATVS